MNRTDRPVIVHVVHSLEGGGTERALVALLRRFDRSWSRHVVVTLRAAGSLTPRLPDHVACQALAVTGRARSAALRLTRTLRRYGALIIHARNTGCWYDAIVAGVLCPHARLVLGFHGLETPDPCRRRHRWLARCALAAGGRFTSVSEAGRRQLFEQAGVPWDRMSLLRNGVDLRRFGRLEDAVRQRKRAELQFDDAAFVVGIVGSLTPVKEHVTAIRAVAQMAAEAPSVRLLVVGDGPLREPLARHARAVGVGDRILFAGWREDVPTLMGCMDAYVCSSASEGMNNALLEAMAAGLPVVATDAGDNAIMVRDGVEGRIVARGCFGAMAEALNMYAHRPDLRKRVGVAARRRAREYDFDRMAEAYESFYRSLLPVEN